MNRIKGMKVYLAGKITGEEETYKTKFDAATEYLKKSRYVNCEDKENKDAEDHCKVMNPAVLPPGFTHEEYMKICFEMINVCDAIVLLRDWTDSVGATMEMRYATEKGKDIFYFDELILEEAVNQLIDLKDAIIDEVKNYGDSTATIEDYIAVDMAIDVMKKKK